MCVCECRLCEHVSTCVHACAWRRPHSCLIHLDSSLISREFSSNPPPPQKKKNLLHCHIPPTLYLSLCLSPALPFSWQSLPLSAGARSGGSQSANLPSICPPPQCQLTPATPHQDSAGRPSPNLFLRSPHHPSSPTHSSLLLPHTPPPNLIPPVPVLPLVSHKASPAARLTSTRLIFLHALHLPPPTPPSPLQPFSHLAPSSDLHLFFSHLSKRHPGCPALFFPETSL